MKIITKTEDLTSFCHSLSKEDFVTVDTEFMREGRYWARLCLIQLAGPGDEAILDPLAEGLDLSPFFDLMQKESTTKVFHAARQDLEIFYKLSGHLPHPFFDTQIAAQALGLGDCISYDDLVQARLQRPVNKGSRYTDWGRRPLSREQLSYAISDVTELRDLYPSLLGELKERDRLTWIEEEMSKLTNPDLYTFNPETAWKKIRIRKAKPQFLAFLKTAAAWREEEAQKQDKPRSRFLRDETLTAIAHNPPKKLQDFESIRGIPKGFQNSQSAARLFKRLQEVFKNPGAHTPEISQHIKPSPSAQNKAILELLRVLLQLKAAEHEVSPKLMASQDDLETLLKSHPDHSPLLQGWRSDIFGHDALRLLKGEVAMKLQGQKVKLISTGEVSET